jgi:uncharacterized RDD family membrane protein YckC
VVVDSVLVFLIAAVPSIGVYGRLIAKTTAVVQETVRATQVGQPPPPMPTMAEWMSPADQLWLLVVGLAVGMLYHTLFLRFFGATPGKMVCGLRVVPVEHGQYRDKLPWGAVLVRAAIWVVPAAVSYLALVRLLDALMPLWQKRRQALHDLAAKTQVVRIR